ncbi:hypothetical protein Pmani_019913 [Petrolisthes manimaculis]|uniref:Uncharacterized protein n=1 Tax=Petrolisthes manimaculis TaxID=1843537 RepID=A0AAE1PIL0_9EUCA|nr:hypothetical protein Pmani_019913 [Petrolisthes manimaculis]
MRNGHRDYDTEIMYEAGTAVKGKCRGRGENGPRTQGESRYQRDGNGGQGSARESRDRTGVERGERQSRGLDTNEKDVRNGLGLELVRRVEVKTGSSRSGGRLASAGRNVVGVAVDRK